MVSSCRPVAPARRTTPRRWGRRLVLADQHRPYQFFLRLSLWDGPAAGIQGPPAPVGVLRGWSRTPSDVGLSGRAGPIRTGALLTGGQEMAGRRGAGEGAVYFIESRGLWAGAVNLGSVGGRRQ